MRRTHRLLPVVFATAGLLVAACGQGAAEDSPEEPAVVEPIEGSDLSRITLTEEAAERIGIETAPVTTEGGRTVVPLATVLYDATGQAWVYTNPEGHVFLRAPISVVDIQNDSALLSSGPPSDTAVVTVGVAELYGTELGVGDPE
jgi:hypothetical protein